MNTHELEKMADDLRAEFASKVLLRARDQFERNAFLKIDELLLAIGKECGAGSLRPRSQRFGYIARLVAESDPDILPPELGGRLMEVEKKYIEL